MHFSLQTALFCHEKPVVITQKTFIFFKFINNLELHLNIAPKPRKINMPSLTDVNTGIYMSISAKPHKINTSFPNSKITDSYKNVFVKAPSNQCEFSNRSNYK